MGCCSASVKCIRISSMMSLLGGILMVAAAFALFGTMGTIADKILCIANGLNELMTLGDTEEANLIPQEAISAIRSWIDLLKILSILPAVICCTFLLFSCMLGCRDSKSYCCGKAFNTLGIIFACVGIVFYALCGLAATLVDTPQAQMQVAQFQSSCEQQLPQLQAEYDQSKAQYDAAKAAGQDVTAYEQDMDNAQAGLTAFTNVCDCYSSIYALLKEMSLPGFLGMAASIYTLIAVSVLCCNQGCCKKPGGMDVKPIA